MGDRERNADGCVSGAVAASLPRGGGMFAARARHVCGARARRLHCSAAGRQLHGSWRGREGSIVLGAADARSPLLLARRTWSQPALGPLTRSLSRHPPDQIGAGPPSGRHPLARCNRSDQIGAGAPSRRSLTRHPANQLPDRRQIGFGCEHVSETKPERATPMQGGRGEISFSGRVDLLD